MSIKESIIIINHTSYRIAYLDF